jgi:hypothetical protein
MAAALILISIAVLAVLACVGWLLPSWFDDHFTPAEDPGLPDRD